MRRLRDTAMALETSLTTSVLPWALLTGAAFVLWLGGAAYASLGAGPFDDAQFDAATWRAADGLDPDCPRGPMLHDLAASHLRPGRPRGELIELLGPPDAIDRLDCASWRLGFWSGFRVDVDTLDVRFDDAGRLVDWSRVQH